MLVEQLRNLQLEWFGDHNNPTLFAKALDSAFDQIGFSEEFVTQCVSAGNQSSSSRKKVVKDNVWGMIELDEPAIRLLDCPVLQRLRRIRQLGFTYLTYPSAEHSRFVHSLGMFGVISRFIQSADRDSTDNGNGNESKKYSKHLVSRSDRFDMQHAALLHDCGHLPFSHATEVALQVHPNLTKVGGLSLDAFSGPAERVGLRSPKLAELLSVAIVLSPRFGRYYATYVRPTDEEDKLTRSDSVLRVASLIMGMPTNNCNIAYSDLISGRVIDADKLDYVSRDGMACGIPTGIDVDRLFLRSAFFRFTKDELNRLRRRSGYATVESDQVHFIVNSSGRDTIEELITARTSLYHRVYFHQTTRNAERLYEQLIEHALEFCTNESDELDTLRIWAKSDEQMLSALAEIDDPLVKRLTKRVSSRQLPKRSVVFGQGELSALLPFRQAFQRGQIHFEDSPLRLQQLQRYSKRRMNGARLSMLEHAIRDEAIKLNQLIYADLKLTGVFPQANDTPHIAVSPAQFSPAVHDDCLVLQNHELVYSKELHNVTQTSDAEEIFKASGYVLTDEPWRELVFVAARKVLAEQTKEWTNVEARIGESVLASSQSRLGIRDKTEDSVEVVVADAFSVLNLDHDKVIGRAGLDARKIDMIEARAGHHGYFDEFPFLMTKPNIGWEHLRAKFERFEGQYGWQISKLVAETFVSQFPPRLRARAVELLTAIDMVDTQLAVSLVKNALCKLQASQRHRGRIRVVPLSPNSGHELRIALENVCRSNEEFNKHFVIHHSLEELFASDIKAESSIALIDDNLVSGSQAFSQLAAWLGIPRDEWPPQLIHESNIDDAQLSVESRERLISAISTHRLSLCVAIGSAKRSQINRQELVKRIEMQTSKTSDSQHSLFGEATGIDLPLYVGRDITPERTPDCLRDKQFVDFLRDAGKSALAWVRYHKEFDELTPEQRKQCKRDSLGYDNSQGLTITFRNVPVSTIACLWAPGKYKQLPWMPLGLRRGYGKRVILT